MPEAIVLFVRSTFGKIAIACFCTSLVVGAGSIYATSVFYKSDIAQLKLDAAVTHDRNTSAALKQFQDTVAKISVAAGQYAAIEKSLSANFDGILKDFRNVKFKAPLPLDCLPDAERVRSYSAAVTAANSYTSAGQ